MPRSKPQQALLPLNPETFHDSRVPRLNVGKTSITTSNQEAAEIILSDPGRYGGGGALMVRWARNVLARPAAR